MDCVRACLVEDLFFKDLFTFIGNCLNIYVFQYFIISNKYTLQAAINGSSKKFILRRLAKIQTGSKVVKYKTDFTNKKALPRERVHYCKETFLY